MGIGEFDGGYFSNVKLAQLFQDRNYTDFKFHFEVMKDGCICANSGHFNVEINIPALEAMSKSKKRWRDYVDEYQLADGKRICLLAEGRLVNLSAAEGHPATVMDMSFANQVLALNYLYEQQNKLSNNVHTIPRELDIEVARLKLESMNVAIDNLTEEQQHYLHSWREGT